MLSTELKDKLVSLFDKDKLASLPDEWGFFNDYNRDVNRIGYAVNLTPDNIIKANNMNVDFFITHHPASFMLNMKENCNSMLEDHQITHAYFHAPLDDADFGNSSMLAKSLGLIDCKKAIPYKNNYFWGVIGELPQAVGIEDLADRLSEILGESIKVYKNNNDSIHTVCINAGGGDSTYKLKEAFDLNSNVYITGGYNLEFLQYAEFLNINLLIGSHTNTELLGILNMMDILGSIIDIGIVKIDEKHY